VNSLRETRQDIRGIISDIPNFSFSKIVIKSSFKTKSLKNVYWKNRFVIIYIHSQGPVNAL